QKVGVYVDVSNIAQNGGFGMHYDVLREFACRNHGIAMRLNAYVAFDEDKAKSDKDYKDKSDNFHSILRDFGFKVIVKKVKWYVDDSGSRFGKANADLDMAVDALLQSDRLDYVILATGDGDFVQVIKALQNKGCRVEVIGFKNVSSSLKKEADVYTSGYLVPDLLSIDYETSKIWGSEGSRVRGICYNWFLEKGYGFMRYLTTINGGMWVTDTRKSDSPYETAFVHESQMPEGIDIISLPNRDAVFEFTVSKRGDKGYQATDLKHLQLY
ncbi:MAG: NYN domain-containing protein, partial [Candidatus Cloacimonetes bacterium]|nr:NYN domain-containing protein [Candidatus Cloacimonadota bacterium]